MNIRIKRVHPNAVIPQYATEGAAGFDLVAVEDVVIAPGETKLVRTGLAFEIPDGYEMQIRPRSGISAKTKLRVANAPATIDSDYRGEVCVLIENIGDWLRDYSDGSAETIDGQIYLDELGGTITKIEDDYFADGKYIIRRGDRIAQGIIAPVVRVSFVEVAELGETERGDGGFGSTGVCASVNGSMNPDDYEIIEYVPKEDADER